MLQRAAWQIVTDFSNAHTAFQLKFKQSQNIYGNIIFSSAGISVISVPVYGFNGNPSSGSAYRNTES
jgi:hypothetical protein